MASESINKIIKDVPDEIEIKTSTLLNVVEQDRYHNIKRMIDEVDFKSRMKIKKKDWFINPDQSIQARKILCLKKSLGYS